MANSLRAFLPTGWPPTVALAYAIGYLYATVPPQVLDPLLQSHVRYHAREYINNWYTGPLAAFVLIVTWLLAYRRANPLVLALPLATATLATNVLVFPEELPHQHVVFVTAVWSGFSATWVWIRYSYESALTTLDNATGSTLEYVKEQVTFFRTLAFGLVAAFLALLVAALVAMHQMSGSVVTDPSDAFLLLGLNSLTMAVFGLLGFFGPVQEAMRSWRLLAPRLIQYPHV